MLKFCELPDGREVVFDEKSGYVADLNSGDELSPNELQKTMHIGSDFLPYEITIYEFIQRNAKE